MPKWQLWKAVMLSLDVEPPPDAGHTTGPKRYEVPPSVREKFAKRMMVCQGNLSTDGPLRPLPPYYTGMKQDPAVEVLAREFAAFAVESGWQVPEEMRELSGLEPPLLPEGNPPKVHGAEAPNALLVTINGRQALPVRAIPHVTGWSLAPDEVARQLARTSGPPFEWLVNTKAFYLDGGAVYPMLPKGWDPYVTELEALTSRLHRMHDNDAEGKAEWLRQSVRVLPASVAVWREQFERDYLHDFSPERQKTLTRERPGERDINYAPLLEPELRALVLQGFGPESLPGAQAACAGETEPKEQREDRRLKMCEDAGLRMDEKALVRLPDGVGKVAEAEGVARQTFSRDVLAALSRRMEARREGRR